MAEELKFNKGDIVKFMGGKYYTRPNGLVYFLAKPGDVKIDSIMKNASHPYHIVPALKSETSVKGWVTEEQLIEQKHKLQVVSVSFKNNKDVRIAMPKDAEDEFIVTSFPWEDKEWIAVFRPKNLLMADKLAHAAEIACAKKHFDANHIYRATFINSIGNAAEIDFPQEITVKSLIQSGLFHHFSSDFYLKEKKHLRRGDILLSRTESAIVLSNGTESSKQMPFK